MVPSLVTTPQYLPGAQRAGDKNVNMPFEFLAYYFITFHYFY